MLKTQLNERRCSATKVQHRLSIPPCCPITKNPLPGSVVVITYSPGDHLIEVASLRSYINTYQGGRGPVRSMEGMIQNIAQDCAECIGQTVEVAASLYLAPDQEMTVECTARPKL